MLPLLSSVGAVVGPIRMTRTFLIANTSTVVRMAMFKIIFRGEDILIVSVVLIIGASSTDLKRGQQHDGGMCNGLVFVGVVIANPVDIQ